MKSKINHIGKDAKKKAAFTQVGNQLIAVFEGAINSVPFAHFLKLHDEYINLDEVEPSDFSLRC